MYILYNGAIVYFLPFHVNIMNAVKATANRIPNGNATANPK